MNTALGRAAMAADRVLQSHSRKSQVTLIELELAGWLLGRAGGRSPKLAKPEDDLHARLAAALGAGDVEAAEALLSAHLPTPEGDKLLFHACHLAGTGMADRLIEIAHRHPGKPFNGRMLARTSQPARLLALFDNQPTLGHAIITMGELVIVGRDAGTPVADAEARWAAVVRDPLSHEHDPRFRDTWLRIAARESLDAAVELLVRLADGWGRGTFVDGVSAVLARLVRQDPARAAAIVADGTEPLDRLAWFETLTWWFELPAAAEPILRELLSHGDPQIDIRLARILASARARQWFERSLATARTHPPLFLARELAPGIAQLREAGLHDEAERVRDRVLPRLSGLAGAADDVAPSDLFETLSAAGLPALVPWGTGPGLP